MNGEKSEASKPEKEIIAKLYKERKSQKVIAAYLNRNKSAIHCKIREYNSDRNITNKSRFER